MLLPLCTHARQESVEAAKARLEGHMKGMHEIREMLSNHRRSASAGPERVGEVLRLSDPSTTTLQRVASCSLVPEPSLVPLGRSTSNLPLRPRRHTPSLV